jgi:hypothetical protein
MGASPATVPIYLLDLWVALHANAKLSQLSLHILFFASLCLLFLAYSFEFSCHLPLHSNAGCFPLALKFLLLDLVSRPFQRKVPGFKFFLGSFLSISGLAQFRIVSVNVLDSFPFNSLRPRFVQLQLLPDAILDSRVTPNDSLMPRGALSW